MDTGKTFGWVAFYRDLAGKLLPFRNNRNDLVARVRMVYEKTGIPLPTLDKDNQLVDLDPFTVFGLFNKASMSDGNRKKITRALADEMGVGVAVPASFEGVQDAVVGYSPLSASTCQPVYTPHAYPDFCRSSLSRQCEEARLHWSDFFSRPPRKGGDFFRGGRFEPL